ncbi:MAG: conjugative transposon protein TraM [Bacteroidota bacterium]
MKINFKQPKYIIPILVLPFLLLFYYIFSNWGSSGKNKVAMADSANQNKGINAINSNMPGVSKDIANGDIKDKFAAYQEAYKNNRDYSALNGIDPTRVGDGNNISNLQSNYTEEDIQRLASEKKMDSLNNILQMGQRDIDKQMAVFNKGSQSYSANRTNSSNRRYTSQQTQSDPILEQYNRLNNGNNRPEPKIKNEDNSYDNQMKLFRDQMSVMDSLQKQYSGGVGDKQNKKATTLVGDNKEKFNPGNDTAFKPLHVSMTKTETGRFNTVRSFVEEQNIMAIIDQDIKATLGSRVRIRLLSDIFAGDYALPKGTYIYGVVTGFQTQRVNISITQLFYNNTPIPVKLDAFDNDGYLGLYVPGSNFREFSKEIGTQGTNGLSSIQTSDNSNVMTGIATQLFQKTTTSVANMIKKNKAFLKYNYIIYLKEKK